MTVWSPRALRARRVWLGRTQKELAADAEIGANMIWLYEQGKSEPTASVIARLADALGVGVQDLFEPDPVPQRVPGDRHVPPGDVTWHQP